MLRRTVPALALLLAACGPSRVDLDPPSVQLRARGQALTVHATPRASNGDPLVREACKWSSSDPAVARVEAKHNDAKVIAAGHGRATVKCAVGSVTAEVPVAVTLVARVEVAPARLELRLEDEARGTPLEVRALDGAGQPIPGRGAITRCANEDVCRGDARGQVWPVGAGATTVIVEVDDAKAEVPVTVKDARTAAGKPKAVKGNPMEGIDRAAR